jgi:branched-subunit amino acid ABC-type transport system permease component
MDTAVIEISGALNAASSLFLASAGLTLIFGAMRVINLAHGSFYMFGAFGMTSIVGFSTGSRFWWAIAVVALAVGAIGVAVEVGVIRRIYGKEHLTQLLATYALFLIFADLGLRVWGSESRAVPVPLSFLGAMEIAGEPIPKYNLVVVGAALAVGVGLWLLLRRTAIGWKIRAAVDDPELLEAGGVNLQRLFTVVFALGALLAGLGGAVISPQIAVTPGIDGSIIVGAFIVTVVGGLGSIVGAAIGALLIGASETAGTLIAPEWSSTFPYLAMILILAARPWGLFGTPER